MSLVQQPNAVNHTSKINEPGGARDHFVAEFVHKPCCAEYHQAVQVFRERECDRRWHLFQMGYV